MGSTGDWEQIVSEKRRLRDNALKPYMVCDLDQRVPQVHNVHERSRFQNDPVSQNITDIDNISFLLEQLRSGLYTAEQVARAYIQRAVIAHQLTNAITEPVFDDALAQARELDHHFQSTGELVGPLHGIPVTVKDQFNLRGVDTTLGYVGRSFSPAAEDAVIVQMLKKMGAIVLLKTNLPQTLMWAETENPLWGRTVNPRNPDLIPGGSSGGEGPLLALHASIFGLGTDIGGSIRIPGSMNGIYAFKPTSSRYPVIGVPGPAEGQEHVHFSSGPMTRDMDSLCYVNRLISSNEPWELDPACAPLPWNEISFQEMQTRPLVIGIICDDGIVKVHPPIARALEEVTTKLKQNGHEIITWDSSDHRSCVELMDRYYAVDGFEDVLRDINAAGEPMIPHVQKLADRAKEQQVSVYEYWQLNKKKHAMRQKFLQRWNAMRSPSGKPLDVLLGPTTAHTAIPHRTLRWVGYTKVWNLLDYPAVTFPVDKVREEIDTQESDYQPRNELDAWNWALYDAHAMNGHPVNLQVIGKTLNDEKVLGAATAIEQIWKRHNR
ncbi:acetamidase [Aspergillus sergii]|uniref:Acetamidase n=1 Tax=Aspergillus sergii TaxID=1034303 RepID=A0A5N6XIH1_9EURO|nr:acetamidase [Aspergillus sergii]